MVITINPCIADCLLIDTTTYLISNNIAALEEYGGVEIVNLYSMITKKLEMRWFSDEELFDNNTDTYIKKAAEECETIILACGMGVLTNKRISTRINNVLKLIKPFSKKLMVITDGDEMRAVHPLCVKVRHTWLLSAFTPSDIEPKDPPISTSQKPKTEKTMNEETNNTSCDNSEEGS